MAAPIDASKATLAKYATRHRLPWSLWRPLTVRLHQSKEFSDCKAICQPPGVVYNAHKDDIWHLTLPAFRKGKPSDQTNDVHSYYLVVVMLSLIAASLFPVSLLPSSLLPRHAPSCLAGSPAAIRCFTPTDIDITSITAPAVVSFLITSSTRPYNGYNIDYAHSPYYYICH
jgi:hypothetical protein